MATRSSSIFTLMLPLVPPVSPTRSIFLQAWNTCSCAVSPQLRGTSATFLEDFRVDAVDRLLAREDGRDVVDDHPRMVALGVIRRAADVRCQYDVGQLRERVVRV